MRNRKSLVPGPWSFVLALALAAGCSGTPLTYEEELARARAEKDLVFSEASDSPIPASRRDELLPLAYFPIDPAYRVPASLQPFEEQTVFEAPTSTGQIRTMQRVGRLEFMLKGQPLSLTAFVEAGTPPTRLFVPFMDMTTGAETYQAGRYLHLDRTATGLYEIDFNLAYNPYCYYDERYDCPFPPPENRLSVPIRAGERLAEPWG